MQLRTAHHRRPQASPWDSSVSTVRWTPDQSHLPLTYPPPPSRWALTSILCYLGWEVKSGKLQLRPACVCPAALLPRKDKAAPHCNTHQARALARVLVLLPLLYESCPVARSPPCSGQVSGKSGPHTGYLDPVIPPRDSLSLSEQ